MVASPKTPSLPYSVLNPPQLLLHRTNQACLVSSRVLQVIMASTSFSHQLLVVRYKDSFSHQTQGWDSFSHRLQGLGNFSHLWDSLEPRPLQPQPSLLALVWVDNTAVSRFYSSRSIIIACYYFRLAGVVQSATAGCNEWVSTSSSQ